MISTRFDVRIPFYLLAALVCSMMLSLFLLQLFAAALSILWFFEKVENKKKAFDIFTLSIIIFGVIRILSIVFSNYPSASVQSFYKDALFYLSFFSMSFYLKVIGKERIGKIVQAFIIFSVIIALIGLVQFDLKLVDRAQSFSSGYATFSSYLLVALGVLVFVPFEMKTKNNWLLRPLGLSIIFAGIITSLGRWNILIAGLVFLTGLFLKRIKIKPAIIIALLTAVISFASFQINSGEVSQRVEHPTVLSDRDVLIKGAKELACVHPLLGFGPRTFQNIFPYFNELSDKGIGSWHNDFVQVYFESGILGLLSFIFIIAAVIFYSVKYLRKNNLNISFSDIAAGNLLGFVALVLSALLAGFINSPVLSILFAFLISLLSSIQFYSAEVSLMESQS